MMHSLIIFLGLGLLAISGTLLGSSLGIKAANTCTPLAVVGDDGTQGTTVKKTVTPPGASIAFRTNWNTDFAVDNGVSFNRYISTIVPSDGGKYTIKVNLKYSDDTADKVYDNTVSLAAGKPLHITATPRANQTPYQVNVYVGELNAVGKTYVLSASGCR
ncbi:hypothetical protein [Gloeothece verrucosa]|uniref:Uncharacterized protein n=1 Tax=Gloeothece verrucosa (strain PCC 7822) TaxID=497965 RepID=E0UKQ8_GLOV7|nr:hypothetical protein [Gloeothece verrucosa]ADN17538.1 conserved hypothetical protein [Gloeothece verrucosa PCC 7822]